MSSSFRRRDDVTALEHSVSVRAQTRFDMGIGLYSVKRMATSLGQLTTLTSVSGKGTAVGVSLDERIA